MGIVESAAARLIVPLSALLQKPLCLVDGRSPEASQSFAIRFTVPRLCIVSADGSSFAETERRLINELFDILRIADESEAKYVEIEQRMVALQRENLDLVVRNRALTDVASRDALTGLYNRWYVIEKIDSELSRALRNGSPMAVLMLDIDDFDEVSGSYGEEIGDQALQWVGKTLRESCRVYDVPGRYGEEEFCVVLPETSLDNTKVIAERIRRNLTSSQLTFGDAAFSLSTSMGIAGTEGDEGESVFTPSTLLDRADRALCSAKTRGNNCIELWESELLIPLPGETEH